MFIKVYEHFVWKCLCFLELTSQICPDGWITFSRSCYFISSESKSWDESRQDCLKRGADLVIIKSKEEEVRDRLGKFRCYLYINI
uniref:C-type lectin domain-containing protein n=1 Tax=Myripristis murdjan TaxID=586833 RepID=A0A667ZLB7_9TELE